MRSLRRRGVRVRVLPHTASAAEVLAGDVAGVVLSPGPGDPARLGGPVALAERSSRTAGRCSGSASGTRSSAGRRAPRRRRLRFGHHGANHPVRDVDTGYVQVTAQNHEVQVVGETLPRGSGFRVSQVNLNDGSVEGLRHATLPIETVQYHPEGAPGPARRPRGVRPVRARPATGARGDRAAGASPSRS